MADEKRPDDEQKPNEKDSPKETRTIRETVRFTGTSKRSPAERPLRECAIRVTTG